MPPVYGLLCVARFTLQGYFISYKPFAEMRAPAREKTFLWRGCNRREKLLAKHLLYPKNGVYLHPLNKAICGSSSVGRASASQAEGREFEPRLPLCGLRTDNPIRLSVRYYYYLFITSGAGSRWYKKEPDMLLTQDPVQGIHHIMLIKVL